MNDLILLIPVLFPILVGFFIRFFKFSSVKTVKAVSAIAIIINIFILFAVLSSTASGLELIDINGSLKIAFKLDDLGKLFTVLISIIWLLVCFYSFEYMKHEGREQRFFAYFIATYGAVMGLGFSSNFFTFYLCYEAMTLLSFPLVMHNLSQDAIKAGIKYLAYSFFGATLVLLGMFFIFQYTNTLDFVPGGVLNIANIGDKRDFLLLLYTLMFIGFGGKAGMFPLHAWLPTAHPVAPSSASAILSGVITKAGVLGIMRTTFFVFGGEFIYGSWAQTLLMSMTLITVFMGSMMAFRENHLKKRLAYSSVSQVSYILFGIIALNPMGFTGSILHIFAHAFIKNTLFLCAGAIIYMTHHVYVSDLKGIGKEMPVTMWCFTIASLALVGIPPLSGFVSKYYLAMGGLSLNNTLGVVGVAVLLISALLTAGYLIPVFVKGFFPGNDFDYKSLKKKEANLYMTVPMIIMTVFTILIGAFPMSVVDFIVNITKGIF